MSLFDALISLFAPDDCLGCRREGSLLCSVCSHALASPPGVCFGCYAPVNDGIACPACLRQSACTTIFAAAHYTGTAKQLVANLKFMGNQSAARVMSERMMTFCAPLPAETLVVHVPATTQHIRERGYDQAVLLARHLARQLGFERRTLLARVGQKHQLGADRQQRLAQLQRALRVTQPNDVQGRFVLLVDDVLTTGASLQAAAAVLLAAGAVRVDAVVFAQAYEVSRTEGF